MVVLISGLPTRKDIHHRDRNDKPKEMAVSASSLAVAGFSQVATEVNGSVSPDKQRQPDKQPKGLSAGEVGGARDRLADWSGLVVVRG